MARKKKTFDAGKEVKAMLRRGRAFLVAAQERDGSWRGGWRDTA